MALDEDLQSLQNYAFFFLKFRPRTVKETRDYLYKKVKTKHWSRADVEKVIAHLLEKKFLDDQAFVEYLVESRTRAKVKGVFAIKQELMRYGVDKDLIDNYFSKTEIDEKAMAEKILTSRWPRFKTLPAKKRFEKAYNLLLRRGFNFEVSRKTVEKLENGSL
jgi:regulatory protein